ncbi:MAG: hypothetical protein RBU45_22095 [Myxococcota bacterium]|jgi:hypothetical protein|nr:hypothetical protein [Myxococcota bacterium]
MSSFPASAEAFAQVAQVAPEPRGPTTRHAAAEKGVLGLRVTYQSFDADRPWRKNLPATRFGMAALVAGPTLVTTAQNIMHATLVEAEKFGRTPRTPARVVHVDWELNLALLQVDDPAFFADLRPLELAASTPNSGTVQSARWLNQQIEVSECRVKRLQVGEARFSRLRHTYLLAQTDLSGGGWAEPVLQGDQLIGLATAQDGQTAWVVPVEMLRAFLQQARDPASGKGFPVLRLYWQWNHDPALSAFLGQEGEPQGGVLRSIPWGSTGHGVLQPRDILLSLDGHLIDSSGYYQHPRHGRLEFTNIVVEGHQVGDVVPATVLRAGQVVELELTLRPYPMDLDLILVRRVEEPPPYVIAGGLVFLELDGDYLLSWGPEWAEKAPAQLVSLYYTSEGEQTPTRRRIILLSQVLPAPYNLGYQGLRDLPVRSINGRPIDSLPGVVEALQHPQDGFHTVDFWPNEERIEAVLDAATLDEATAEILVDYQIPAAMRLPKRPLPEL